MTKARSPNYPQISLPKAIELTKKLYDQLHKHKASAQVVAEALGYNSLNGASLGVISALKKYGLLEPVGEEVRVSALGLNIIAEPEGSRARSESVVQAAYRPALFAELRKEYGDVPPKSDDLLRAFLLKRGFVTSVVETPIRTYRETAALVAQARASLGDQPLTEVADAGSDEDAPDPPVMQRAGGSGAAQPAPQPLPSQRVTNAQPADQPADGVSQDVYTLADGRAFVLRWPTAMSKAEYEDFEAWIALLQRKLKRHITNEA